MAFKTLQQTASQADVQAGDILAVARSTGALSHVLVSALVTFLETALATVTGFAKTANDLSDLASAASARTNLGAAASSAPTITGGMTFSGSTKSNVVAAAALDLDVSTGEIFTKSISSNSVFTISNPTAAKGMGFILFLTITSAAVPTWPGTVKWEASTPPTLGNGSHMIGFVSPDGGVTWVGNVGVLAYG